MRKDFVGTVLAAVQNKVNGTLGVPATLTPETLLDIAKAYGFVEGKRGRDGGYQATDAGLAFVGEDVEAFRLAEAQREEAAAEAAKVARKAEKLQKIKALKESLNAALENAA